MKQVKIGLLGLGNIGTGTYKTLEMNRDQITTATGTDIRIVKILERDTEKERDINVKPEQFTQDINVIINDPFMLFFRETPAALIQDRHRMFDTIGWAALLPQLLAAFGVVFETVGMGGIILEMTESFVVIDNKLMAAIVYCVVMAFFSMMMGNAFPDFLVVSSGIGIQLIRFGATAGPKG